MKIAVLGTGNVGQTIANKLVEIGHEVTMGSRSADNEKASAWATRAGQRAGHGTFADAAAVSDLVFNCVNGGATLAALEATGAENLAGKILVDLANPLDFSNGMPPTLSVFNTDSLGEQIQRAYPDAKVVKTLNTMSCEIMVDPSRVPGDHDVFVSGDDDDAKAEVTKLLKEGFGWTHVIDLGGIATARGVESWLPLWLRLWGALGTGDFNLHIVRADA